MKLLFVLLVTSTAFGETQVAIAEKENHDGVALMVKSKFAEAANKFRSAADRVPEPKYFFNLCTADDQQGKFGEALTACNAVLKLAPSQELQTKTDKLIDKIKVEAKAQNIDLVEDKPADRAAKSNQEGVDLMLSHKFAEAETKFRAAADVDPQAGYFFNLCSAQYQRGIFGAALVNCEAVSHYEPAPELQTKADKLIQKIKDDAKAQNVSLAPIEDKPGDRASKSNDEGKDLMYAGKYADAVVKFRDAVARDPQAKYFFNLCSADYQVGKFREALDACKAVAKNKPTADLQSKSIKMIVKIRDDARAQKINLD